MVGGSVSKWSVVGGSVVGGFDKTHRKLIKQRNEKTFKLPIELYISLWVYDKRSDKVLQHYHGCLIKS